MPIASVYSKAKLTPAAVAEGLTEAQARAILAAAPTGWLEALVAYIRDTGAITGLAPFRAAFPQILKTGSDAGDSFLVRVAAIVEGGMAV